MKVLWVMNKELDAASDRAYIVELSQALFKFNINLKIIARYKKEKAYYDADIQYVDTSSIKYVKQTSYLTKLPFILRAILNEFRPEIVVADRPTLVYPFWFLIKWAKKKKLSSKFILDVRSLPNNIVGIKGKINLIRFNTGIKIAATCFDGCLTITKHFSKYIQKKSKFSDDEIGIWSSAFNERLFNPTNAINENKLKKNNSYNIIFHGAIAGNRSLKELVEAMTYTPENFVLNLLGEGPLLNELKKLVNELNLDEKVFFYPSVPYAVVPDYLQPADVGIVPIPNTLWFNVSSPIKLLEYMAMGLPIIAPETVPVKHVAGDNADIAYYSLTTASLPKEMGNALNRAYKKWNRNYFSERNRKIVIERFTWQSQATAINAFFIKINNKK